MNLRRGNITGRLLRLERQAPVSCPTCGAGERVRDMTFDIITTPGEVPETRPCPTCGRRHISFTLAIGTLRGSQS
jgi:predicted RNA-binding Zn-ribbon protein involved in translation (DUF1610 family)